MEKKLEIGSRQSEVAGCPNTLWTIRRKHIGEFELLYIIKEKGAAAFGVSPEGARTFLRYCFLYSHLQRFCLMCATTLSMSSGLIIPAQAVIIGDLPTAAPPFVITFTRYSSV